MALIKKFRIKSYDENSSVLQLKNISVFYNKRQILNNLNLSIKNKKYSACLVLMGLANQLFLI